MRNTSSTPAIVTDGDLAANVASFARHLRAANLSPKTQKAYLEGLSLLASYLSERGMPTDVDNIRREHLESFIEDQLARWKPATDPNRLTGARTDRAPESASLDTHRWRPLTSPLRATGRIRRWPPPVRHR